MSVTTPDRTTDRPPAAKPKRRRDPTLNHIADSCCPPYTRTLCGIAIAQDAVEVPGVEHLCVVCEAMHESFECPRCVLRQQLRDNGIEPAA